MEALEAVDDESPRYINDKTDDEISHAAFLKAYIASVGGKPVNLDDYCTLPSSPATGTQQIGRLTNLMNLIVETSWWIRYRSPQNPDFGATFPQFIKIANRPAIPSHDLSMGEHLQAIANTAAFHFDTIEQGGSSLYDAMSVKVSDLTVLRVVTGIGGAEVFHFAIWSDSAGNVPPVKVPGLSFPDIEEKFEGDPKPGIFSNAERSGSSRRRRCQAVLVTTLVWLGRSHAKGTDGLAVRPYHGWQKILSLHLTE